ncbi:MAG TPA: hypothetical protein VGN99_12625 [Steroidobacteraceae bacterium]|jgi:hypothetical protein|nr:hypothetical protein [Steroidobacteraceae bacterium]
MASVIKFTSVMKSTGAVLLLLAATSTTSETAAAGPSAEGMARCAAIQAPDTRLSCYDALAHRPADKTPVAVAKTAPAPAAPPASSATSTSSAARVPSAAAVQAPTTAAAVAVDPQNFGLTAVQQHAADLGPKSETAHISIVSSDQTGRTFVVLDSGQTWAVMDSDGRLNSGDAVTIKRAALGSFLMLTPSNHSYRVRRVK